MRSGRFIAAMAEPGGGAVPPPRPPSGNSGEAPPPPEGAGEAAELHGWKEIAAALNTNVRTAQKYERYHGLPVRRMPGKRGRVYALREEILAWRDKRQPRNGDGLLAQILEWPRAAWAAVAGGLAVGGLVVSVVLSNHPPVASLRWNGPVLEALDERGRTLWTRAFSPLPAGPDQRRNWTLADLAGEGRPSVLFLHQPAGGRGGRLYCLDSNGELVWAYPPEAGPRPGSSARAFVLLPAADGRPQVALALVDEDEAATRIRLLDAGGRETVSLLRQGVFDLLAAGRDAAGAFLIAGGFDRGRRQAALLKIVLRAAAPAARPAESGPPPVLAVQAEVRFPRTRLNRRLDLFNRVTAVRIEDEWITVRVRESAAGAWVEYRLGPDLQLRGLAVSDALKRAFRKEFARGVLRRDWSDQDEAALLEAFAVVRTP